MNSFWKKFLKIFGLNFLAGFVLFLPVFFISNENEAALGWMLIAFILAAILLFVQFVVAFTFILGEKKKELGQAMLLTVGVIVLIGFSVCSGALR